MKRPRRKRGENLAAALLLMDDIVQRCKELGFYSRRWSIQVEGRYQSPFPGTNAILSIGLDCVFVGENDDSLIYVEQVTIGGRMPENPQLKERIEERLANTGFLAQRG